MNIEEVKDKSRFIVESYRTMLLGGVNESPEQYLKRMKVDKEEATFVMPYLKSTRIWYDDCADLFDQCRLKKTDSEDLSTTHIPVKGLPEGTDNIPELILIYRSEELVHAQDVVEDLFKLKDFLEKYAVKVEASVYLLYSEYSIKIKKQNTILDFKINITTQTEDGSWIDGNVLFDSNNEIPYSKIIEIICEESQKKDIHALLNPYLKEIGYDFEW